MEILLTYACANIKNVKQLFVFVISNFMYITGKIFY